MLAYKHSGMIGDLIYSLPVIKYFGKGNLYLKVGYNGFAHKDFDFIKSLLEDQDYINNVKIFNKDEIDFDLDLFRKSPDVKNNLFKAIFSTFEVPLSVLNEPWVKVQPKCVADIIVNRTPRYNSRKAVPILEDLVSKNNKSMVFVGLFSEWCRFCRQIGFIPFHKVESFWETARIIEGSKLFVGNQSSALALAFALNKNIIEEVSDELPNCILPRSNVKYIVKGKLIKEIKLI